jgi:hypothetical protein
MNEESYTLESFDKDNFQPMYRDSIYASSNDGSILILPGIRQSNPAEEKNKKLVSLLRSKMFKGYEKIKIKDIEEHKQKHKNYIHKIKDNEDYKEYKRKNAKSYRRGSTSTD